MNQPVILITGATSGFGRAIATRFAESGPCHLILNGRRAERLEQAKEKLEENPGVQVTCLHSDVRDKEAVFAGIEKLRQSVDRIDVLINNAGLAAGLDPIGNGDTDDWDLMLDTNVRGLLYVSRAVMPWMQEQRSGHIINIGSTAAKLVYRNGGVYSATKHAVDALTQSMRIDLLEYGIKVTAIHPGAAETEFSLVRFKGDADRAASVYEGYKPLQPEDVAEVVYYSTTLPPHVCINDLVLTCITQANGFYNMKK